jgi:hypothetical protein
MAIDFPASPTLNDVFTVGNVTYVWDGTKWTASVTGGISLDKIEEGNTSAEVIDTGSDGRFVVTTEGTERLRVTNTGLVGIGNNAPGSPLEVQASSNGGNIANDGIRVYAANRSQYANFGYNGLNATNTLEFGIADSVKMKLDSSGSLGIGTSTPATVVDIEASADAYITIQPGTTDGNVGLLINNSAGTQKGVILYDTDDNYMLLSTENTERMRIDSAGRLGIGTATVNRELVLYKASAPAFHIQNSTSGTGVFDGFAFSSIGADATIWNYENGYLRFGTNDTERLRIDSSGRVGIGTTPNSDSRLHVKSGANDSNPVLRLEAATNNFLNFRQTGTVYDIHVTAGDPLSFTIGASERARIDSSGRLLVGTSSASGFASARMIINSAGTDTTGSANLVLQVGEGNSTISVNEQIGNITFGDESGYSYATISALADLAAGSDSPGRLVFSTTADGASSPTERMRITRGGDLFSLNADNGIVSRSTLPAGTSNTIFAGQHSAASIISGTNCFRVYTNGNVQNTNNSYGALSDIKLKENIVDANSQWDDLKALQVRNYNFKEGQTHTQIGLVAQEVELVSPGLVTESPDRDEDGNDLGTVTKSVNYSVLYMKAVKALQEAMTRIETLEGMVAVNNITIDEQQHQLSTLAARLTALETP